uniref:uracil phosphoribosyltransferase n=1 Tax=Guillardia theta TaxID=55529 RepID=A0A7S4NU78_GUITH
MAAGASMLLAAPRSHCSSDAKNGKSWFVKPWTSFQAAASLPDKVPGYERVHVIKRTYFTISLFTQLRDLNSSQEIFVKSARHLISIILSEALNFVPFMPKIVNTPVDGATYTGLEMTDVENLCVVSILRAADSMADHISHHLPGLPVGKILIQRDEKTAKPNVFFKKFPKNIQAKRVILVDPMLATGGSAAEAIQILKDDGVPEHCILMVCIVAADEGLQLLTKRFPQVRIVCGEIDRGLNSQKYIVPGLGDFGDRFFGTN